MHARVEHLLSLRDGEPVAAAVRAHVEACSECAAALADATRLCAQLQALPAAPGDAPGWDDVRRRLAVRSEATRRVASFERAVLAASVAVIALAVAWRFGDGPTARASRESAAVALRAAPLTAEETIALERVVRLRTESAALEDVLALLGDRPVVQRAGTTVPIDTLEAQVQWLDHRISGSGDAREAERLWRDKVDTMNSLVRLRYVEAQHIAM
jgi:hypothetical protein